MPGNYGSDSYGFSPYGGQEAPFGVLEARALQPTLVQVVFNDLLDLTDPHVTNPNCYVLSPNTASVHTVTIETAGSVRLITDYLSEVSYTVTVTGPTSYLGNGIDDALHKAAFTGFPQAKPFRPVAVSYRKIRLLFGDAMLANPALSDPASYAVVAPDQSTIRVTRVTLEGNVTTPTAIALDLDRDLTQRGVHNVQILSPSVCNIAGLTPQPKNQDCHWVAPTLHTSVPIKIFTGELRGGLLGRHNGLVFFSPAYQQAAPNSAIQVDSVKVQTRAYDVYTIPQQADPSVLFTYKKDLPTGVLSSSNFVTFAPFDKLTGAKLDVGVKQEETFEAVTDSHCVATLTETLAGDIPRLNAVQYYNDAPHRRPVWPLANGVTLTPFRTASATTQGSVTTLVLEP